MKASEVESLLPIRKLDRIPVAVEGLDEQERQRRGIVECNGWSNPGRELENLCHSCSESQREDVVYD